MGSAEPQPRGARPLALRDWPFGAVGRRMLLEALLLDEQPDEGWTTKALERRIQVSNGGLDQLLAGAVDLGLADFTDGRIRRAARAPELMAILSEALRVAQTLPDRQVQPLPRRPYRRPR